MHARVVVIGAGAIGCAVALQLARCGIDDVLVVDRNPGPGMGSTGRANGGVRAQFTTPVNIVFSTYTIAELAELDRLSGGQAAYRPVGYLFLAGTDATAAALHAAMRTQRSFGVPVRELSARQVRERVPCIRTDGLLAAAFCGSDGLIDPNGVVSALCAAARERGCRFVFDTPVLALETRGTGAMVRSAGGDITADVVVNAAGPQAAAVAALADVALPVQPHRRNLACTEPIAVLPRHMPMCVDADSGILVRREGDGALIGYSPANAPSEDTSFDPAFLDEVAERAPARFPFLVDAAINPRKCWAGLYPETPDHHAIIDSPPQAPWFIQCAGFGGHGIMHCVAAGQAVADLVRGQDRATFDLSPLRLGRFSDGAAPVETAIL
jgi:glycine/D-amino acid oxidase-like deaminating enzyme